MLGIMMSEQTDTILPFLSHLGLSLEEGRIYLYLRDKGGATALQIAKDVHLGRTRVYRILDSLKQHNLVEYQLGSRGLTFLASNPSALELLVTQKKTEITGLESSLTKVIESLNTIPARISQAPKTIYYEGLPGLLAMTWNTLDAKKGGIRIWELSEMTSFIPDETSEDIRREFVRREIYVRQLTNISKYPAWTKVTEFVKKFWQIRYLDPQKIKISFEIAVYNNVVAMYSFKEQIPYCVELHDESLAQMHKQMFDLAWEKANRMTILSDSGQAEAIIV
jgi:sugar-specific transcriptional regulator TrmB